MGGKAVHAAGWRLPPLALVPAVAGDRDTVTQVPGTSRDTLDDIRKAVGARQVDSPHRGANTRDMQVRVD